MFDIISEFKSMKSILLISSIVILSNIPIVNSANSQARSLSDCIVVSEDDGNVRYFRNICNETLHWQFEITGGRHKRTGNSCNVGRTGGYTFGPGYGPVNLILSGCGYTSWTCNMRRWNSNGGSCN